MTKPKYISLTAVCFAAVVFTQSLFAQSVWIGTNNVSATTNWSDANNWSTLAVPTASTTVIFTNNGASSAVIAEINNVVDTSTAISALRYVNTNANEVHTTFIPAGVTLSITGSSAPNTAALSVGTENLAPFAGGNPAVLTNTITGAGALVVSNTAANIIVRQAPTNASAASVATRVTLDLSGLDTFSATVGRILLAANTAGTLNRASGKLILAKTNYITASGTSPALIIGDSASNNGNGSHLILGQTNVINVNNIWIAREKESNSRIAFNPSYPDSVAIFRAADGVSRIANWNIGDGLADTGTTTCNGAADFTGGTVNALVTTMQIGRSSTAGTGASLSQGFLTIERGTFDVNTLQLGLQATNKAGNGVVTLNGPATLIVNTLLQLGVTPGGNGITNNRSILNVRNGAFAFVNTITAGAGTNNSITLSNATFVLTNTAGPGIIGFTNIDAALTLRAGTTPTMIVTNLAAGGATNVINVSIVPPITNYPAAFTLIDYTGTLNGATNFGLGTLPVTSPAYSGYVTNNADTSAIELVLTGGPQSRDLHWTGAVDANWDIVNTLNWETNGTATYYNDTDRVLFDEVGANKNVNVTTAVNPGSLTVDNTSAYSFTGAGRIYGQSRLTKLGSGSLFLGNSGSDSFSGGVAVSNGSVTFGTDNTVSGGVIISAGTTVQVGTNGGTGSLPAGNTFNDGTLIFNRGADLTASAVISGASTGSILKTNAGVLTLSGANTFTGSVLVANGTLRAGNASALGRTNIGTTIANGATLDVGGFSLGFEPITVEGAGVAGAGAIVSSGAQQVNALRLVTLTGNTVFGGTGRWDIRDAPSGSLNAVLSGGGFTLTKVGTNQVSLVGVSGANTLGDIVVQQGTFGIETGTDVGTGSISVSNGATLLFFQNSVIVNRNISVAGDGVNPSVSINSGSVTIANPIQMSGNVVFGGNGTSVRANGGLQGTANLIKTGTSRLSVSGSAGYSGSTVVSNGTVIFDGGKSSGTGITVEAGGAIGGSAGNAISESLVVNGGGITPGNPDAVGQGTLVIGGNATLNSSTNLFELSPSAFSGNDQLTVFGNLTLTGTNSFRISVVDHLTVGDVYTLVTYFGAGTGIDTNSVVIIPPTFGYEFALVDPVTTPGEIRIQVLVAIGFDSWLGNHPTNPTLWDNGVTVNWLKAGISTVFTNGDFAHFSDFIPGFVGSSTNITLAEQMNTAGVVFSNSTAAPFNFVGPGGLSGGGFTLEGEGPVTIANAGSNTWTGGSIIDFNAAVFFNVATLIVGDGSTNGNLGGGNLTNRGTLVINRAGSLAVSNNISGGGTFTNIGSGLVTLNGTNTFTNTLHVLNGTIIAGSTTALGATNGITLLTNNATLDVNGLNLGAEPVLASGNGVSNRGAIVNNGTNDQVNAIRFLTLAGNVTLGGDRRWDLRGAPNAALLTSPSGSAFNITKVGTNQVALVAVTNIESTLNNIDIQEGVFAIQTSTTQLGDPNGTITIRSNATLNIWDLTQQRLNKNIVVQNGGTIWSDSGTSTNIGPVTLNGISTILNDGGTTLRFASNTISGSGSLVRIGGGTTILQGVNTYSGHTVISNGTLALVGASGLSNSTVINLTNAGILDVSARTDSALTILSGQTLKGSGTVRGSVAINPGGALSPGQTTSNAFLGTLSITNALNLSGTTFMDIDAATATNDRTTNSASVTYGGSLVVSNLSGTLAAGQSFRLFAAGSYSGSFSSITLPPLSLPLYWTNTLSVNGRIAVATEIQPNPTITAIELVGGNVVIRGTNNNGATPGPVYILASTNLLLPLSNWTVLATNAFDGAGTLNFTNGAASEPQQYYMLQLP